MQLSCLPVSFFADIIAGRMSLAEWAAMGARLGLDAIDLSILLVPDRSSAAVAAARRAIEDQGMRVAMVTSYPDFTHPDPARRERELLMEQEVVAVAAGLGASLVRVTTGQAHPATGRAEGLAWAISGLSRLAETTRHLGVRLVYENHSKPGAWEYTDFAEDPDVFLQVAQGIASAGIGINFDAGNAATFAADPVALLDRVIDRVVSLHASDSAARGRLQHVQVGTGLTPYPALLQRLVRAGWDGWICIEEASNQGERGVAAAVRYIREAWQSAVATAGGAPSRPLA